MFHEAADIPGSPRRCLPTAGDREIDDARIPPAATLKRCVRGEQIVGASDIRASDADAPVGKIVSRGVALVASYVRMHPAPFVVAVTSAAVYAATTVGTSVVFGRITDTVITPAFDGPERIGGRTVIAAMAAIVGVALLRGLGIVGRRYFAGMFVGRTQATLRTRVAEKYQELPLAYHRSTPTGELLAHAEADVDAATDLLHPLPYSTAVILIIVIAVVALLLTDWVLAIVGLALIPALAVLNVVFTRRLEPLARRAQEQVGEVSNVAHESFDGALVVKTLGLEGREAERLAGEADELRRQRLAMGRIRSNFDPAVDSLPSLATVALFALGAWRISSGAITVGVLVQFATLFALLTAPLRVISYLLFDFPRSLVGHARIRAVLDEPVTLPPASGSQRLPDGPLEVRADDVHYRYGDIAVLDGLSLHAPAGSTVAVVGATGAGKSTLAQLLVRLADPLAGTVRIGGADLRELDPAALRTDVAVVFQESFLFATSVRDNITLGVPVSDDEVVAAATLAQAHRFITALPDGYATQMGERGVTLSGGQRQRVALARALVRTPRVLILDDATSAVDPVVEARILAGLRAELQTTLIVVAYRVSTISLADHVVFVSDGKVAASGTHAELLATTPAYEAMVRAYERIEEEARLAASDAADDPELAPPTTDDELGAQLDEELSRVEAEGDYDAVQRT